ncbi:MAG: hypothetical protein L3K26_00165 [Candidatus Hydrogenedentes bacterium]|nr:hypothetical protein [Candidatus Hydrogenedentota bacterium]
MKKVPFQFTVNWFLVALMTFSMIPVSVFAASGPSRAFKAVTRQVDFPKPVTKFMTPISAVRTPVVRTSMTPVSSPLSTPNLSTGGSFRPNNGPTALKPLSAARSQEQAGTARRIEVEGTLARKADEKRILDDAAWQKKQDDNTRWRERQRQNQEYQQNKQAEPQRNNSVNVVSRPRTTDQALNTGHRFVGDSPDHLAPGVYRSQDGTRQFRLTDSDIQGNHGQVGPHVHFEKFDPLTGDKTKNIHTPLKD